MPRKGHELNRRCALSKVRIDNAIEARCFTLWVIAITARMLVVHPHNNNVAKHTKQLVGSGTTRNHGKAAIVGEGTVLKERKRLVFYQELGICKASSSPLKRGIADIREQITANAFLKSANFAFSENHTHSYAFFPSTIDEVVNPLKGTAKYPP